MFEYRDIQYLALGVAIVVALVAFCFPYSTFPEVTKQIHVLGQLSGKLRSDTEVVNASGSPAGLRYITSYYLSLVLSGMGAVMFRSVFFSIPDKQPKYVNSANLWLMPLLLAGIFYLAFFDTWLATVESKISRGVFGSHFSVFWPPLIFATLLVGLQRTVVTYRVLHNKSPK